MKMIQEKETTGLLTQIVKKCLITAISGNKW